MDGKHLNLPASTLFNSDQCAQAASEIVPLCTPLCVLPILRNRQTVRRVYQRTTSNSSVNSKALQVAQDLGQTAAQQARIHTNSQLPGATRHKILRLQLDYPAVMQSKEFVIEKRVLSLKV